MKERPIMFSPESVVGILAECKTQTRRVITAADYNGNPVCVGAAKAWYTLQDDEGGPWAWVGDFNDPESDSDICIKPPYGIPGDRLWVRESWRPFYEKDTGAQGIQYHAGGFEEVSIQPCASVFGNDRWRHAMFMPRWASRITLEITDIRVERVQEISEADAICEGCRADEDPYWRPTYSDPDSGGNPSARRSYEYLWDTINGKRNRGEYAWVKNPWVWVIDFWRLDDVHKAR